MVNGLCMTTLGTGSDIVGNEGGHVWPMVLPLDVLHCLANPWVTCSDDRVVSGVHLNECHCDWEICLLFVQQCFPIFSKRPRIWLHILREVCLVVRPKMVSGDDLFSAPKTSRSFPTPTSDTFGILQTPTTSKFQRHFGVLLIPSPFQQPPTLLCAPSTPTPCPTPPPKITPRPPPPLKVAWRPLWTPYPLI